MYYYTVSECASRVCHFGRRPVVFIIRTVATGCLDVGKFEPNKVVDILAKGHCN